MPQEVEMSPEKDAPSAKRDGEHKTNIIVMKKKFRIYVSLSMWIASPKGVAIHVFEGLLLNPTFFQCSNSK